MQVAPQAELRDTDTSRFNGAQLTEHAGAGAEAGNSLLLGGRFSIDSQRQLLEMLFLEPRIVGLVISNGQGLNDLVIRFNANANQATVQDLISRVFFQTDANAKAGPRVLKFLVHRRRRRARAGGLEKDRCDVSRLKVRKTRGASETQPSGVHRKNQFGNQID